MWAVIGRMAHAYLMRPHSKHLNTLASWKPKNWGYDTLSCDGLSVRGSVSRGGSLQHGQSAVLAVPYGSAELGPYASSGRAWRLRPVRNTQGGGAGPGCPATALGARADCLRSRRTHRL